MAELHDLKTYLAKDPDLVIVTARSEVQRHSGKPYANGYCFMIRLRGDRVIEHTEFFNPVNVTAAFG